jgi:3D (Asp-Asp-Asp) domain-containing protein
MLDDIPDKRILYWIIILFLLVYPLSGNETGIVVADGGQVSNSVNTSKKRIVKATIYAYNAEVGQTDGNPLMTASGVIVKDGIIANNCLPFGTKVVIENKIYEVADRMASYHDCNSFDLFMWSKKDAIKWGIKRIEVAILEGIKQ